MESVFSNVPGRKLYAWVRVASTTHTSREIQEQHFFGAFQKLFQLFSQTIFHMLLQDTTPFLQYLLFFIVRRCLPLLAPLRKR